MKLIDRISLSRLISMILGFLLSLAKIFAGNKDSDSRKPILRRRKKSQDQTNE